MSLDHAKNLFDRRQMLLNYLKRWLTSPAVSLIGFAVLLAACSQAVEPTASDSASDRGPAPEEDDKYADLQIVTLLPRDAIPAIDDPKFISAEEANNSYDDDELILGVEFNGDARAYSVPLLSRHEIVNDTVGGTKIAVTW